MVREWRGAQWLPDPLGSFRENGYSEPVTRERHERNIGTVRDNRLIYMNAGAGANLNPTLFGRSGAQ